jgi:beta-propeller repeat-containing protein
MSKSTWRLAAMLLCAASIGVCPSQALAARTAGHIESRPQGLFEQNRGQFADDVAYRTHLGVLGAAVLRDGSLAVFSNAIPGDRLAIRHAGYTRSPRLQAADLSAYKTNYFRAGEKDVVDVAHYRRIVAREAYPGIDVAIHAREGLLEFDYEIAPGADASRIAAMIEGARGIALQGSGDLLLTLGTGMVRQRKPEAYQVVDGVRRKVDCDYALDGATVRFKLGAYDTSLALVIDPVVEYSSYLGGSNNDWVKGVAIGPGGYLFVAGSTSSTDFPVVGAYDSTLGGGSDAFVTKIDPITGKAVFSTYVGGSNADYGMAIAVDSDGAIYLTGLPASRFPTTSGAYQASASGTFGFVTKLAKTGSSLVYSTFIAGTKPNAIAVDAQGRAVVTGTAGTAFLTTAGTYQPAFGGFALPSGAEGDAFVLMLNAAGSAPVFATFVGGDDIDEGRGIALDAAGRIVIAGSTQSTNFPAAGGYQSSLRGTKDGFVMVLAAAGNSRVAGTYLGGTDTDTINSVAVDPAGNIVVVGNTASEDFPTANAVQPWSSLNQSYQVGFSAPYTLYNRKGFLAKLGASLATISFSTFTGGAINCCDTADSVAVDSAGDIYMGGFSRVDQFNRFTSERPHIATTFVRSQYNSTYEGEANYAAAYSRDGSQLRFRSYVAGCDFAHFQDPTTCQLVFVNAREPGQVLIGGSTLKNWVPIAAANTQAVHKSPETRVTGFLTRLSFEPPAISLAASNMAPVGAGTVTLTATSYVAGASGSVTFWDDAVQIGSAPLVEGIARLAVTVNPGVRKLSARWNSSSSLVLLIPVVLP